MKTMLALFSLMVTLAVLAGCPRGAEPGTGPGLPMPGGRDGQGEQPAEPTFSGGVQEVDELAPDFTIMDTDGHPISLRDFSGEILVLDFWATWCAPCIKKLKEYEPIIDKYADQGVTLLAVSLDSRPEVAVGWAQKNDFPFPIAMMDETMGAAYFPEVRGSIAIPQVRIIDRDGNLRYRFTAESTAADLELALGKLVAETVGGDAAVTEEVLSGDDAPQ